MTDSNITLAACVSYVKVKDKDIWFVGTAHVSKQSVEDVKTTIEAIKPDTVCVELCEPRFEAMTDTKNWQKMNVFKIIRERKSLFLLAQLIMAAFYRRLGEKLGVQPGAEMLEAIKQAQQINASLVLADRKIEITLKRVWGYLGFWNKMKLISHFAAGIVVKEEIDADMVEKIKQQDQLEHLMEEFTGRFPEIKRRLIDERDIYMSQKIRNVPGSKIVAVVGAGHVEGIKENIQKEIPLDELLEIPPKSITPTIFKWAIPAVIIGLLIYGFFRDGTAHSIQNIYIWILVNGILSAFGAAIALAHPITIVSAFVAAPLTSLNPMLAAGWVAGLVQAWVTKPTVADFEELPNATSTLKGFWTNRVTKILLVVVLANLGSVLGTYIAGTWIAARSF